MNEFTKNILILAVVASFVFVCHLAYDAQRKVEVEQAAAKALVVQQELVRTKSLRGDVLQLALAQDLACVAPRSTAKIYIGATEVVCKR